MKVIIKKSTNPKKKYMAIFYENKKKVKTTHFGAAGMSDYTKHKDKSRKRRYLTRHRNKEKWNEQFEKLKLFCETNGHCNVPYRHAEDRSLAMWVATQRQRYKKWNNQNIKLKDKNGQAPRTPEWVSQLEDIGFKWESKKTKK